MNSDPTVTSALARTGAVVDAVGTLDATSAVLAVAALDVVGAVGVVTEAVEVNVATVELFVSDRGGTVTRTETVVVFDDVGAEVDVVRVMAVLSAWEAESDRESDRESDCDCDSDCELNTEAELDLELLSVLAAFSSASCAVLDGEYWASATDEACAESAEERTDDAWAADSCLRSWLS